jgi:putative selenium metabolism hydrolase
MKEQIIGLANQSEEEIIAFTRKLIQTPSISGDEKMVADLCMAEMIKLGYDQVFRDGIGNIIGIIKGTGGGKNIMFNSHLDHVDPGDLRNWEYEPYGAIIHDGYIHGRAASDDKGGIASQIYAGAVLKKLAQLKGDFIFSAVVQEEPTGMFGIRYLCDVTCRQKGITFDLMISSEATSLNVFTGHRGRMEIEVTTLGRTCHASTPERGINAVYHMIPLIEGVRRIAANLPKHVFLGKATLALTNITCLPGRLSIVPDVCKISLDRRLVPGETAEQAMGPIMDLIRNLSTDPAFKAEVGIKKVKEVSYTGYTAEVEKYMDAWSIDQNHEYVVAVIQSLKTVGQNPEIGKWDFATDASYVTGRLHIPAVGYSPMEEQYAHTAVDRVKIENIIRAVAGNAAIAFDFCG